MENDDDRFLVVCSECGAVYAGVTVSSGDVQAIGCREGCASCGSTEFAPVSDSSDDVEFEAAPSDD